jgi:hypothetical protein
MLPFSLGLNELELENRILRGLTRWCPLKELTTVSRLFPPDFWNLFIGQGESQKPVHKDVLKIGMSDG